MIFWAALLSMHNTCFSLSCWWCTVLWSQGWFMIHVYSCIQSRFFKVSICPFTSACALPLLIRLTDVAYFQGKDGAGLFLRLGVATGMKQLLKEHVIIAGLKASTEMFLCQGSSSDSGFALFLPSSPFLSLRHAQLHQVPRGSNGDFGRSGVVRMPGGRWAQASHYLDEKGKESQLPALWGTTRELPVWSVWMCNTSLSHTFTAHYLSAFVWYRAAGHTLSFYRTYATCRSRRCVCI